MRFPAIAIGCLVLTLGIGSWLFRTTVQSAQDIKSITIVHSLYFWDGGTTLFCAYTDSGRRCWIGLNQHMFKEEHAGRLAFNGRIVGVRSDEEKAIVRLLATAKIKPVSVASMEELEDIPIVDEAMIDNCTDNVETVDECSTLEDITHHRDDVLEYIESDEYIEIANYGVPY